MLTMNESAKKFISKQNKILDAKKAKFLETLRIYDKEYAPSEDEVENEYYLFDEKEKRHYKNIPAKLTDEEYQQVLQAHNAVVKTEHEKNGTSITLKVVAYLIWCIGMLAALAVSSDENGNSFNAKVLLTYLTISIVSGLIFWALGEIIRLLNEINNKF